MQNNMKNPIARLATGPCAAFVCAILFSEALELLHRTFPELVLGTCLLFHSASLPTLSLLMSFIAFAFSIAFIATVGAAPLIGLMLRLRLRSSVHFALAGGLLGSVFFGCLMWRGGPPTRYYLTLIPDWSVLFVECMSISAAGFIAYWLRNVHRHA